MNKRAFSDYSLRDPFKWLMIIFAIFIIVIGILVYISYNESSKACNNFGGKLSGGMNCIKDGVSYELDQESPFSFKMQVVRRAVDIGRDTEIKRNEATND